MSALRIVSLAAAVFLIGLTPAAAVAQDACTVLTGGTVYLPEGPREGFSVVLTGDRIADLGSAIPTLELGNGSEATWGDQTCSVVQLDEGDVLTPGLVHVGGQLGLVEIGLESGTRHHDAGGDQVRAAHDVADSYDARSTLVPVARLSGITSAVIEPTGGMVAGQSAWVDLAGGSQAETVVRRGVAFPAAMTTASRAEGIRLLRELLDDARAFARDRRAYDQNRTRPYLAGRADLEALQPVLRREAPLVIWADRAADIEAVIRFADAEDVRVVIRGAAEGWLHAEALAEASIAVILNPLVYGAGSFDQVEGRADNAALLAEAGVPVIISTGSAHFARGLRQLAGNAVRGGMDHTDAVRSITSTPAQAFGQADRGEIARGAYANLVVWSGDPLELSTSVELLLIGGEPIALESRQTRLFERYRVLPGTPLPALPLPGTTSDPTAE